MPMLPRTMTTTTTSPWRLQQRYRQLPPDLYADVLPTPVAAPRLLLWNAELAAELGLAHLAGDEQQLTAWLSGNELPPGAEPLAQAYAGHQFGHFTMLGDGRAILLGEQQAPDGRLYDVQLKGAGVTPFSRRGDGRATLRSMLREYLISEAMHHLGIASSRSLAVVATGQPVYRERVHPGAVLTRIMRSHLRVGTLEFARHFAEGPTHQALQDYLVAEYYPTLQAAPDKALALLEAVMWRQLDLVLHWLRVGFIHGVMNTDNCSLTAETFDYGPCAFMNVYNPATVYSSIDTGGRYAYHQQPGILQWNMAILATALLPLMQGPEEQAVEQVKALLDAFAPRYHAGWNRMMCAKIGLAEATAEHRDLVIELLTWMQHTRQDFTDTFRALLRPEGGEHPLFADAAMQPWLQRWRTALAAQPGGEGAAVALMEASNPSFVPRNHLVEAALDAAEQGDLAPLQELLVLVRKPYSAAPLPEGYGPPAPEAEVGYQTFCGT